MVGEFRLRGAIERVDRHDSRFYIWEGHKYWSVTTLTQVVPKPWLGPWSRKVTSEFAVAHLDLLQTMLAEVGPDATVDYLKRQSDRVRDAAATRGSAIHEAAEQAALGIPREPWTDVERPYMEGFERWVEDWRPRFEAIESPLFSRSQNYAGTLDTIVTLEDGKGPVLLIDYKTGKKVYAETALQLAAYRHSETFIGLPDGDEDPTPPVDACAVLRLHPELPRGYEFVPIRSDQTVFDMFLYVRELFRWQEDLSKTVVSRRAIPEAKDCVREGCGHSALLHTKSGCMAALHPTPAQKRKLVALGDGSFVCQCVAFRATPFKRPKKAVKE